MKVMLPYMAKRGVKIVKKELKEKLGTKQTASKQQI